MHSGTSAPVVCCPCTLAMERGADLDKLQQLMELQQRWEASEARKAFVAALDAPVVSLPAVVALHQHRL